MVFEGMGVVSEAEDQRQQRRFIQVARSGQNPVEGALHVA